MAVPSWIIRASLAAVLVAGLPAVFASPAEADCRKGYFESIGGKCVRYHSEDDFYDDEYWANFGPWANWGALQPWSPWGRYANWGLWRLPNFGPPSYGLEVESPWEFDVELGTSTTATRTMITRAASGFPTFFDDIVLANSSKPSSTGFAGGIGVSTPSVFTWSGFYISGDNNRWSRYAPEARNAYAASFPIKAPPPAAAKPPLMAFGFDARVYFFAGGDQNISGIPGGPFGTATGLDSFKVSNNVLFTVGGLLTVPVTPSVNVALTGGFAELNQTVKYNCVTFCAVAPAAPGFTASQDKWISGAYVGGRFTTPLRMPGLPAGSTIGIDYKHVFFGSYDVSLGSAATQRLVGANLSPDMDLVTARLAVPIGRGGR